MWLLWWHSQAIRGSFIDSINVISFLKVLVNNKSTELSSTDAFVSYAHSLRSLCVIFRLWKGVLGQVGTVSKSILYFNFCFTEESFGIHPHCPHSKKSNKINRYFQYRRIHIERAFSEITLRHLSPLKRVLGQVGHFPNISLRDPLYIEKFGIHPHHPHSKKSNKISRYFQYRRIRIVPRCHSDEFIS